MADSANQHYVPQFYFRGFSANGRSICFLNRGNGGTIPVASIKGQASKKYFYGDAEVERNLQSVDGAFSNIVKRLRERPNFEELSADEYYLFLQNIMLQKARTMSERSRSKAMQDRLLQLHLEMRVHSDESLDEDTRQAFLQFAAQAEADPRQYQIHQMSIALECVDSLLDLLPVVLENRTNRPYIFGDAPVVFTNPHLRQIRLRGVLGTQTPGLMILYPLSPIHQVALLDENVYRVKRLQSTVLPVRDLMDISALNRLQIQNASSAVYFHNYGLAPYVVSLWHQERGRLANNLGAVVEAPGFDHKGEPMGDILHSFERQLPLIPRFSFLEHAEVPEREYRFARREAR